MAELPSRYQRFGKEILDISVNESSDDMVETVTAPDEPLLEDEH